MTNAMQGLKRLLCCGLGQTPNPASATQDDVFTRWVFNMKSWAENWQVKDKIEAWVTKPIKTHAEFNVLSHRLLDDIKQSQIKEEDVILGNYFGLKNHTLDVTYGAILDEIQLCYFDYFDNKNQVFLETKRVKYFDSKASNVWLKTYPFFEKNSL